LGAIEVGITKIATTHEFENFYVDHDHEAIGGPGPIFKSAQRKVPTHPEFIPDIL